MMGILCLDGWMYGWICFKICFRYIYIYMIFRWTFYDWMDGWMDLFQIYVILKTYIHYLDTCVHSLVR